MHIVIDGYNLIRQSDHLRSFDRRSLEEGRNALIQFLAPYKKGKQHTITVVFDAWDGGGPLEERDRQAGIEIVYSRRGRKADDVIKAMVERKTGEETLVVSSDREVADYALHRGITALSSLEFERAVLRFYVPESFPVEGEDIAEEEERSARGTKKKGPSRRISRGAKNFRKRVKKL
ncbi:MAG: NYN domain-containing protein [Syntrophaceae bacterium]|nr:NYN domain-containing protein [Syntrophaceae bacterium]